MATSSFYHNIVIKDDETAERFVKAIESTRCAAKTESPSNYKLLRDKGEIHTAVERMVKANAKL